MKRSMHKTNAAILAFALFASVLTLAPGGLANSTEAAAQETQDESLYFETVVNDEPNLYLPMNDAAGTSVDDVIDGRNGSAGGNFEWLDEGGVAGSSSAVRFGGNSNVALSQDTALRTNDYTVETWVRSDAAQSNIPYLYRARFWGVGLQLGADGAPRTWYWGECRNGTQGFAVSEEPIVDGEWHHVVATKDSENLILYVDGREVARDEGSPETCYRGGGGTGLGQDAANRARHLVGDLDQFALYDYALSPEQVDTHYCAGLGLGPGCTVEALSVDAGANLSVLEGSSVALSGAVTGGTLTSNPSSSYDAAGGTLPNELECQVWDVVDDGVASVANGVLSINSSSNLANHFYSQSGDAIEVPEVLEIEARLRVGAGSTTSSSRRHVSIGFTTESGIGNILQLGNDEAFLLASNEVVGQRVEVDTDDEFHDWAVRVSTANGEIEVLYDGQQVLTGSTFSSEAANGSVPRVFWGEASRLAAGNSEWEVVSHNAAAPEPCAEISDAAIEWELISADGPPIQLVGAGTLSPSFRAIQEGTYTIRLTATSAGTTTSDVTTVTVTNADPVLDVDIEASPTDGAVLLSTSYTDVGIRDEHTATIDWGDGTDLETVPVAVQGAGWGAVSAAHVYAEPGDYQPSITIEDNGGGAATQATEISILSGGNPPQIPGLSLWAEDQVLPDTLRIAGRDVQATGRVNTNNALTINGDTVAITEAEDGIFTVVGEAAETGRAHGIDPTSGEVSDPPVGFDIGDYQPGGRAALAAGTSYFDLSAECAASADGQWASSGSIASGLYWAPCNIDLAGSNVTFDGPVTFASNGEVRVSGRQNSLPQPFIDFVSIVANGTGDAVKVSGDGSSFPGAVLALSGNIWVSGIDHVFTCGVLGQTVLVTGQGHTFDQSSCTTVESGTPDPIPVDASPIVVPDITTDLVASSASTVPGETVTFTGTVTNSGTRVVVPALLQVTNISDSPATVSSVSVLIETLEDATNQWTPVEEGSLGGYTSAGSGVTTTGSLPDTVIEPGATANVGVAALFELSPEQLAELVDPAIGGVRLRVEVDSDLAVSTTVRIDSGLAAELRAASPDATDVAASLEASGVAPVALTSVSLAPGESIEATIDSVVDEVEKTPTESNESFASRLTVLDRSTVSATLSGLSTGAIGTVPLTGVFASTDVDAPVISYSFSAPTSVRAGSDLTATIEVTNSGSLPADVVATVAEAGLGDLTISGLPAQIAAGETITGIATLAVPDAQTESLVLTAELSFDGGGVAAELNPETEFVDVLVESTLDVTKSLTFQTLPDGQFSYLIEVRNAGDDQITGVVLTDMPSPVVPFVDGSLETSHGTAEVIGDTLRVDVGDLGPNEAAIISYVLDTSTVGNSVTSITNQATISSNELDDVLSDDPAIAGAADPTVLTFRTVFGDDGLSGVIGWFGDPTLAGGLFTPEDGAVVTEPTDIGFDFSLVEVPEGRTVESWRLIAAPYGSDDADPIVVAEGAGEPPATLGAFDPTTVENGPWLLRIEMIDDTGALGVVDTSVIVEGELKLGRYSITYEDLNVDVGGLPIQVLRTYDTLNRTESGDFGFGWDLDLANFRISSNGQLGFGGWQEISCGRSGFFFTELCFQSSREHFVTVTWPDGRVESFDLTPEGGGNFFPGLGLAEYTAKDERTTSTLSPAPGNSNLFFDRQSGHLLGGNFGNGGIYDPSRWVLTDRFGAQYILDADDGLIEAIDRNGNTVRVTDDGVFSSNGPSITFDRDANGRITEATGPDGESVVYTYDAVGDLIEAVDQNDNPYVYGYDDGHYLTDIDDPGDGAQRILTYDDDGRLTSLTDAEGNVTQIDVNVDDRTEIVTDPDGQLTTISQFDERGNALSVNEIYDGTTNTTTFVYDELDEVTSRTDPEGNTWSAVYDGDRNLTRFVDAEGNTSNFTYDTRGLPTTVTDADGETTEFDYDNRGNLVEIIDTRGGTQTFGYDSNGNQTSRTDQVGREWTWSYDSADRLSTATDPRSNTTTYAYDGQGRVTRQTAADGGETSYAYDDVGNLTQVTDPLNRTTRYAYNERDVLTSVTDPSGAATLYRYDENDRVISRTDPTGRIFTYTYEFDRLATETAPDGGVTSYTYDGAGRVETLTDPLGRTTTYVYDGAHRRTQIISPIDTGATATTTTAYDGNGRVAASTNGEAETTNYVYDALGRLDSITDPIGRTTSYSYDPTGNRTSVTNANSETTNWVFDLAGQLTSVTNAENETTDYTYDPAGNLATVTDPLNRTTTYTYDEVNRRTATTLPSGDTGTTVFDVAGQVETSTSPAGFSTTFSYDPRGLVESITDELGNSQASAYDNAGRLITATDGRGNDTTFTYDPNGRLETETDPEGGTVTFGYDLAGQRTSLIDPNGAERTWTYDDGGRQTAATDAEDRTTSFVFDAVGRQTSTTDARGVTINNTFDDAGQLTAQTSPNETRSFTYDSAGRRTAWTDATGNTTVTFDDVGRMTEIVTPAGTVAYGYNAAGEQTTLTQPEGTVTTGYGVNGFVETVTDWRGDTITMVNDADGRMTNIARSNGVDSVYGYDSAGRLDNISHTTGATLIDSFTYTLDGNGNRTAVTSNAGTESYVLDGLNRLTAAAYPGAQSEAFSYDAAGNRTSHTQIDGNTVGYTVDATGQLISDTTGITYTYDGAGNLTGTSAGDAYIYDDFGRATEITAAGVTQTYGYDAADVRVTVDGTTQLWDRNGLATLISTSDGDNYVHANGVVRDSNDWLLADALGSVRATVDQTGIVSAETAFTAYGETLTGTTDTFGFAGEQHDPTGLQHLRARQYNPGLGRLNSVDPVQPGAPGTTGYNLYTYAANNPTTYTDPTGMFVSGYSATLTPARTTVVGVALIGGGIVATFDLLNGVETPQPQHSDPVVPDPTVTEPVPGGSERQTQIPALEPGSAGNGGTIARRPDGAECQAPDPDTELHRFGRDSLSVERITSDSIAAVLNDPPFPHGISVSTRLSRGVRETGDFRTARAGDLAANGICVEQTGSNRAHHTVHVPEPIDQSFVDLLARLFL